MKKISIVIPAYNEEEYLHETLICALAQDYRNFEVIVVDNGSTDSTEAIARSFPRVKVLSENNKGTQFARECGRKSAKGDIIAFLDADCRPAPDWLSQGISYFDNPNVAAVAGPYDYFDGSEFQRTLLLFMQRAVYIPINVFLRILGLGGILVAGNCFVRSHTLEGIGGLDTSYTFWGDDTNTARRLSRVGKIIFAWHLVMKSSARRLARDGTVRVVFRYVYAFFKAGFFTRV